VIVDKVTVYLQSGKGGQGNFSFISLSSRKIIGGGGDGGRGGDVILKVNPHLYDLSKFKGNKKFIAEDGERGKEKNKKGKDAPCLIVNVPCGTRVIEEGEVIVDLVKSLDEFLICRGGAGGRGNYKKDYTVPPQEGRACEVVLDYRIPNDVAILSFANSGKTSLFNILTSHNYKVADYPFTTTSCIWAKTEFEFKSCVILDTPPLRRKKAPAEHRENTFLRHIFRSKIIILLSDNFSNFRRDFADLEKEISLYEHSLLKKKKIFYLLNKIDKIDKQIKMKGIIPISAKEGIGIDRLKAKIFNSLG